MITKQWMNRVWILCLGLVAGCGARTALPPGLEDASANDVTTPQVLGCVADSRGGHQYLFCPESVDWDTAKSNCEAMGHRLVTIDDEDEQQWVSSIAWGLRQDPQGTEGEAAHWWIGYNDRSQEQAWQWVDGSPPAFEHWCSGEPNDTHAFGQCVDDYEEDCAVMNWRPDGCWNDYPCSCSLGYYICEAPAPSGLMLWNTLDSPEAVENSLVGPGGTYQAPFGTFVPDGRCGGALRVDYDETTPGNGRHWSGVRFPPEAMPLAGQGTIELWGRLEGFTSPIRTGHHHFFMWATRQEPGSDELTWPGWSVGFNGNNGGAGAGLTAGAGEGWLTATGSWLDDHYFADILGGDGTGWHHYALVWSEDGGIPGVPSSARVALFLDGSLHTYTPQAEPYGVAPHYCYRPEEQCCCFDQLDPEQMVFVLVEMSFPGTIWVDELLVWDHARTEFDLDLDPCHSALR